MVRSPFRCAGHFGTDYFLQPAAATAAFKAPKVLTKYFSRRAWWKLPGKVRKSACRKARAWERGLSWRLSEPALSRVLTIFEDSSQQLGRIFFLTPRGVRVDVPKWIDWASRFDPAADAAAINHSDDSEARPI